MEQYIYIFTIILEIIVCTQFCFFIFKLGKKIDALNLDMIKLKKALPKEISNFRTIINKVNKTTDFILKIKHSQVRKVILCALDLMSVVSLFKTTKTFSGIGKINFLRKLLSTNLVKNVFTKLSKMF